MNKFSRLSRYIRYLVTFVIHFAHGGASVIGVLMLALVGYQYARFGSDGLNPRSMFGYAPAGAAHTAEIPEAASSAPAGSKTTLPPLTRPMALVADAIAKRHHLSPLAVDLLVRTAQREGAANQIDPVLILSIITVESRFNPYSQSAYGAQGLMQIVPRSHTDKMSAETGVTALFNPVENIRVGTLVLKAFMRTSDNMIDTLQKYAGAARDPEQRYATKVLQEYTRLCEAAGITPRFTPPRGAESASSSPES